MKALDVTLDRFTQAQDSGAFNDAMAELRAGRKTTHWVWYVFPQLGGFGTSPLARRFGLDGLDEARAYLGDATLSARLLEAMVPVAHDLEQGTSIEGLMGSRIDALKLVSSMTLFEGVAATVGAEEIRRMAAAILDHTVRRGFRPCRFTQSTLDEA